MFKSLKIPFKKRNFPELSEDHWEQVKLMFPELSHTRNEPSDSEILVWLSEDDLLKYDPKYGF